MVKCDQQKSANTYVLVLREYMFSFWSFTIIWRLEKNFGEFKALKYTFIQVDDNVAC
jgi:hypothetical protein